jgi:molybdopterin/thiamine biosynthesis adenylyltransferase
MPVGGKVELGQGSMEMNAPDRTFERIEALFDVQSLSSKSVLIAGCGSGGSNVALQLVMSGVRNFTLVDTDTLEIENVIRHACGRRFVGQRKVDALAELLQDRNPKAQIEKICADIMTSHEVEGAIQNSDLVILATDNDPTRYKINDLCVQAGIPFVVGRVFTRGIGGEVFSYRPDAGGCLACLEAVLERSPLRQGIREIDLLTQEERDRVYGMEVGEIKDSPGLAVDISFITSFHARFALDSLARQLSTLPKYFLPIEENYLVWGNRPVRPFTRHFQTQPWVVDQREECSVCSIKRGANV